ncbi:MAG: Rnf-Nqr domain containing protein [Oscillospiraceae bacterium]|jgi:electron transport complex protein RnfA
MSEFFTSTGSFLADCFVMALVMIFVENMIFTRALGTSTALVIIRKKNNLLVFGLILTLITVLSGIVTWFMQPVLENLPNANYFRPLIYAAVISLVYLLALVICGYLPERWREKVKPMIHITAFNCVVLGTLLLAASEKLSFGASLGFGIGAGAGFALAMFFLSVAYDYLYSEAIPKAFRGFPVLLIYIGLLSLAFYGLVGHQLPY